MTRYARSGSTQKHRKMPGDATPWEKWNKPGTGSVTNKKEADQDKKKLRNKRRKLRYKNKLKALKQGNTLKDCPQEKQTESPIVMSEEERIIPENSDITESKQKISPQFYEVKKESTKRKNLKSSGEKGSPETSGERNSPETSGERNSPETSGERNSTETPKKTNSPKSSKEQNSSETLKEKNNFEAFSEKNDPETCEETDKSKTFINKASRPPSEKKTSFLERLRKNRADKGILLLPPKIEQKLYNIKKTLREKGLPVEYIKMVIRKERRKAELKMRKLNKPCLNCRQVGHLYADCPLSSQHGICFKCGSTEHTSSKCSKDISGYPFAKCFICNEQGHISKDCPKNNHGVYIKGGKCHLCGNVNHFKKDCPTLKKQQDEEVIVAYTIDEGMSLDHEIVPTVKNEKQPKPKKAKVVKF